MLALALVLLAAPPVPPQRLVTGTGLRIRAAPEASAAVVEKVALGSVLPCLEESPPVAIGERTASFCRMERGWYFTALTEPLQSDRFAQVDRLIEARTRELPEGVAEERWPDVYQLHMMMLRRIDERSGVGKLKARLAELSFVATHASAFHADPRVVGDDSQGPRVKNSAFEKMVKDAKGTAAHEDATWALYQHGWGGECEGDPPCVLGRAHGTACTFLASFPKGERARLAVADIIETLVSQAEFDARNGQDVQPSDAAGKQAVLVEVNKLKSCVANAGSGDTKRALELLEKTANRYR